MRAVVNIYLCNRESKPLEECPMAPVSVGGDDSMADLASRAAQYFIQHFPSVGRGEMLTSHLVAAHPILVQNSGHFYDVVEAVYFGMDGDGRVFKTSDPDQMPYSAYARVESRVDRKYDPSRLAMGAVGGTGGDEAIIVDILSWLNDNGLASATISALSTTLVQRLFPTGVPRWLSKSGRDNKRLSAAVDGLLAGDKVDVIQVEEWFRRQLAWDQAQVARNLARSVPEVQWLLIRMGYRQVDSSTMWTLPAQLNDDRKRWLKLLESDELADHKITW